MNGNRTTVEKVQAELPVHNELAEFRRLWDRIENKNAIRACLVVQQDIAYSAKPLAASQAAGT